MDTILEPLKGWKLSELVGKRKPIRVSTKIIDAEQNEKYIEQKCELIVGNIAFRNFGVQGYYVRLKLNSGEASEPIHPIEHLNAIFEYNAKLKNFTRVKKLSGDGTMHKLEKRDSVNSNTSSIVDKVTLITLYCLDYSRRDRETRIN